MGREQDIVDETAGNNQTAQVAGDAERDLSASSACWAVSNEHGV